MNLFTESSWEANKVGDKLSSEIFQKNNRAGQANRSGSRNLSGKNNHTNFRNKSATKKLTTNHAKRKANKRKKALAEAEASGQFPPKKWARKTDSLKKEKNLLEEESSNRTESPRQDVRNVLTKSQRKRQKQKLKKISVNSKNDSSDDKSSGKDKLSSPIKNLNLQRLGNMLAAKEKMLNIRDVKEPESLRERMMSQLRSSRFRFLNETLYNNDSSESKKYFKDDPDAFVAYHTGYKQQVEQWPLNPLDIVISSINKMPKDYIVADFGCGEARLAESVSQKVHSFDLVAINDRVKACDMAHTPLLTNGVNVVVFCLSLMGTNLGDYLLEANRVLKMDGTMKIADVESRFENVDDFITLLKSYGFVNTWKDLSHNLFYFMDFKKNLEVNRNTKKLPPITLKSCLYKKR